MKFKVVHTGQFDPNMSKEEIVSNLSDLFDVEHNIVETQFFDQKATLTLIEGLSDSDAKEYCDSLIDAGVLAKIEVDIEFSEPQIQAQQQKSKYYDDSEIPSFTLVRNLPDPDKKGGTIATRKITRSHLDQHDNDELPAPSLWNGFVRVGKFRFFSRILTLIAITFLFSKIINVWLFELVGGASSILIILIFLFIFFQLFIFVNQRLCDTGQGATIMLSFLLLTPFCVTVFENFNSNINTIHNHQLETLISVQKEMQLDMLLYSQEEINTIHKLIEQKKESIANSTLNKIFHPSIKWISLVLLIMISYYLLTVNGSPNTNLFGAPPQPANVKNYIIAGGITFILLCIMLTPVFMKEYKVRYARYITSFYQSINAVNPIPKQFEEIYLSSYTK